MSSAMVVLLSTDEDTRSSFRSVVDESPDIELVHVASSTDDLVAVLDDGEIDVVIIDVDFAEMPALDMVRNLAQSRPLLATVVIGRDDDQTLLTSAIETGARGVIRMPLSLQDVQARIDGAASWSQSLRRHVQGEGGRAGRDGRGKIITVAGSKGGSGTTVLTTLLGLDNAESGQTVCLVDLDLRNGHLGFYCGVNARRSIADLAEVASELTARSVREVVNDVPAGFAVLTSPDEVERAEDISGLAVRQILSQLRMQFSVILVDIGCTLDEARATALEMADSAILVVGSDVVSLRAGRRMLEAWERLSLRTADQVSLVVNRVSRDREVQPDLAQRIIKAPLLGVLPDVVSELEAPINTGTLTAAKPLAIGRAVRQLSASLGLRSDAAPVSTSKPRKGRRRRGAVVAAAASGETGQASIELPMMLFIFGAVFMLCLQGLALGAGSILARHASNEVAREASVGADSQRLNAIAKNALPLGYGDDFTVQVDAATERVTVRVRTPRIIPGAPSSVLTTQVSTEYEREPQ